MKRSDMRSIITYPKADPDSVIIIKRIKKFAADHPVRVCLVDNPGRERFCSVIASVGLMLGDSSDGIVEFLPLIFRSFILAPASSAE